MISLVLVTICSETTCFEHAGLLYLSQNESPTSNQDGARRRLLGRFRHKTYRYAANQQTALDNSCVETRENTKNANHGDGPRRLRHSRLVKDLPNYR